MIGVGIDGSRACDAFGGGKPTGFRGTEWIELRQGGRHRHFPPCRRDQGQPPLPQKTYVTTDLITAGNFAQFKDRICHK